MRPLLFLSMDPVTIDATQWAELLDLVKLGVTGIWLLIGVFCSLFVALALFFWRR